MLSEITIEGYRGFGDALRVPLAPCTLIVGDNATGKTSVLEALQIIRWQGHPTFVLQPSLNRGLPHVPPPQHDLSWRPFFHQRSEGSEPVFSIAVCRTPSSPEIDAPTKVVVELAEDLPLVPSIPPPPTSGNLPVFQTPQGFSFPIGIRSRRFTQSGEEVGAAWTMGYAPQGGIFGVVVLGDRSPSLPPLDFVSARLYDAPSLPQVWSQLDRRNATDDVLKGLKSVVPEIVDLRILMLGNQPRLYAALLSAPSARLPVELLGEGMHRIIEVLIKIAARPRGILLIDEIDFGVHFSRLPTFFRTIFEFAREVSCQLVITTHSHEALDAAVSAITPEYREQASEQFSIVRLQRSSSGQVEAITISDTSARAALDFGVELR